MSVHTATAHGHFAHCGTQVRISTEPRGAEHTDLDELATVTISTGACAIQTYLTRAECLELSLALNNAAIELGALEAA